MNFLVLEKDYKILVHNLSIYEKVEQSTHWIIQKKWGKDFTFGSDCTVLPTKKSTVCWRRRKRQGKRSMTRTRERTEGLYRRDPHQPLFLHASSPVTIIIIIYI